ncbi:kinase-like protein [Athelia psychrophila]|uniref:Kinase-like protein n=1 Tax=Athelia psychrophila TaxID=1759441 RepID=A0A166K671_9AGAM|nr:kinase-like protein [Fibularhizoctonia sp. CBS 109695]
MSALAQTFPLDLTGKVKYEAGGIAGGHGHVGKGSYISSDGSTIIVAVKIVLIKNNITGKVTSVDLRRCSKRGRRERKVWLRPAHENVIPLLGITTDYVFPLAGPNPIAMISPWMERGDLFKALQADLPESDRLHLLLGVAKGLQHIHSLGIIHGDLYPANVLINGNGNACLTDFGLSFIRPEFLDTSYWSRTVGGAMRWRAPELLAPMSLVDIEDYIPDLTWKCDIYSFGSLALHLLSGEWPYHTSCDYKVIIHLHRRTQPPRPQTDRITDAHWGLITGCWGERDNPSSRPTAQDVVLAISAL